ncbi:outer membrane protein assembly factor BamD [Ectothiorhodospira mobilis]|uniref:Outer membrane protein assembly factor BamD n=2 Tax=Ectothiorhodospira mobilis TaxID=195064 RepID=A0A1I4R5E6_ECTMO|nr:outer membrane protein assembly factor BamD [Ectothiorhodospira mobilis]
MICKTFLKERFRYTAFAVFPMGIWMMSGCATAPSAPESVPEGPDLQAAVAASDCAGARAAVARLEGAGTSAAVLEGRLQAAYACLHAGHPEAAFEESRRFLQAAPRHTHADYARYLAAVARFRQWEALHAGEDPPQPDRDSTAARGAFVLFRDLVRGYPDSPYREEAVPYLMRLRQGLAAAELRAARAAADPEEALARAQYVEKHYGDTPQAQEALALRAEIHEARGEEARARALRRRMDRLPADAMGEAGEDDATEAPIPLP